MKIDMKLIKEKLIFAYDSYKKQIDNPEKNIDWLEGLINGVYVQEEGNKLYIIFRGTDQNQASDDVNVKFNAHKLPYEGVNPKIWVHTGLIDLYTSPGCRDEVWSIGHSQGGGTCQLCAVDLQYAFGDKLKNLYCVPVSSMRVGNDEFVKSFNKRVPNTLNVWRGSDMVPHTPLDIMGYKQAGKLVVIDPRNFFDSLWNTISAPFSFLIFGRKQKHSNPDHFWSVLQITANGPDFNFVNDHDIFEFPEIVIETDSAKYDSVTFVKSK